MSGGAGGLPSMLHAPVSKTGQLGSQRRCPVSAGSTNTASNDIATRTDDVNKTPAAVADPSTVALLQAGPPPVPPISQPGTAADYGGCDEDAPHDFQAWIASRPKARRISEHGCGCHWLGLNSSSDEWAAHTQLPCVSSSAEVPKSSSDAPDMGKPCIKQKSTLQVARNVISILLGAVQQHPGRGRGKRQAICEVPPSIHKVHSRSNQPWQQLEVTRVGSCGVAAEYELVDHQGHLVPVFAVVSITSSKATA